MKCYCLFINPVKDTLNTSVLDVGTVDYKKGYVVYFRLHIHTLSYTHTHTHTHTHTQHCSNYSYHAFLNLRETQ